MQKQTDLNERQIAEHKLKWKQYCAKQNTTHSWVWTSTGWWMCSFTQMVHNLLLPTLEHTLQTGHHAVSFRRQIWCRTFYNGTCRTLLATRTRTLGWWSRHDMSAVQELTIHKTVRTGRTAHTHTILCKQRSEVLENTENFVWMRRRRWCIVKHCDAVFEYARCLRAWGKHTPLKDHSGAHPLSPWPTVALHVVVMHISIHATILHSDKPLILQQILGERVYCSKYCSSFWCIFAEGWCYFLCRPKKNKI